jgi:acylphosphatase
MEPDCRAEITVTGRVQGVGFRYSTLQVAKSLNLTGFVKNLPDDSVYIQAQGSRGSVMNLIEWCKKGPSMAMVHSVHYQFLPLGVFRSFQILGY